VRILNALEEAIVRDPDDLDAFAVYGDWLVEQGDPRGELIATQLAAEQTGDPEIQRAALRVFAKHRDAFIGDLGDMIATRAFTWRAGFIHHAAISVDCLLVKDGSRVATSLVDVASNLLGHPSAKFLVSLSIETNDVSPYGKRIGTQRDIVDAIVAAKPLVLRKLQLGDLRYGRPHIGGIAALSGLPQLRDLVVEGEFSLGKLVMPELRSITLRPTWLRRRGGKELVEAQWPKLQSLHVRMIDYPDHVARDVVPLVMRKDMPELEHLAIINLRAGDELVARLPASPLLPRLRTLDLTDGNLTDKGVRPILRNPDAFRHLAIDLTGTKVTPSMRERLATLLRQTT